MENELILEELPSLVTIGGASTVWAFVPGRSPVGLSL